MVKKKKRKVKNRKKLPPIRHSGLKRITRKGIYYFPTFTQAREFARKYKFPTGRIIAYDIGWAIQLKKSGPYVGPKTKKPTITRKSKKKSTGKTIRDLGRKARTVKTKRGPSAKSRRPSTRRTKTSTRDGDKYVLGSTKFVYTPGIVAFLKKAYKGGDKKYAIKVLTDGYGIGKYVAEGILSGDIPIKKVGETIVFYVEVIKPPKRKKKSNRKTIKNIRKNKGGRSSSEIIKDVQKLSNRAMKEYNILKKESTKGVRSKKYKDKKDSLKKLLRNMVHLSNELSEHADRESLSSRKFISRFTDDMAWMIAELSSPESKKLKSAYREAMKGAW